VHHSSMRARRFAAIGASTAAIAVLATAGCSSSGTSAGPSSPVAAASDSAGTPSDATTPAATTSGTIDVGFAGEFTGTVEAFPAIEQAGVAAAKWVNAHGGLAGKKINLVTCDMQGNSQAAQACGQQFANDPKMPFAILTLTFDGGPFYAAMSAAHKPILGGIGVTPADNTPADTYFYYDGSAYYYAVANAIKQAGWKSVAYIYENQVSTIVGEKTVASQLAGTGVQIKATEIPTVASDLTPQISSADVTNAAVTVIQGTNCPAVATAMQGLGVTPKAVLTVNSCLSPSEMAANPSLYAGWIIASSSKLGAAGSGSDPDTTTFLDGWDQYGPGGAPGSFSEIGWGTVLTAAKVFQNAKTITPQSAQAAISSYAGPVVMGQDTIHCPGPAAVSATCATGALYYKVTNGKLVPTKI
jgi:ABC-type branched-subunit amino acid transport system substrate-binding protein